MADTAVTVQTEIDNSLARMKNPSKNLPWTDANLLKLWNKGMRFVYQLLIREASEIGITAGTITMTATQSYALSGNLDDFWVMAEKGVYFTSAEPLVQCSYEDVIRESTDTTDALPTMFCLDADNLLLVKTPTATAVAINSTLNCRYFKYQADKALTDNCPWKNIFNEAITMFMDSVAFVQNEVDSSALAAIYNTLEEQTLIIINKRRP